MGSKGHARMNRGRGWIGALLVAGLGHALVTHAAADDTDRIAVLEQKLDESLQMIRELSAKVHTLETQAAQSQAGAGSAAATQAAAATTQAATAATQPAAPGAAARQEDTVQRLTQVEQTVGQMAANVAQHAEDTGLPLHGFADVGVGNHNAEFAQYQGADVGALEFFLTPRLGPRTRALFEMTFEVGSDGNVGVDLERAQIGYQFADSATLWLGRFHTPYGFYNTAFHHGQQIATSLRRPRFIDFEDHGGIMPAHTVGLWLTGSQKIGDEKLTYDFYVGNGQRIENGILDMRNAGNTGGSAIVGGNLGLLMSGVLDGLKVGVDAFQTRIEDDDVMPVYFTRVRSYGTYAAYDTDTWEDIAEFHVFDNFDLTGHTGSHHSDAGFVQMGYRAGRFTPYARYERGSFQQADHYFAAQINGSSYDREALGVRFDVDLASALKLELAGTRLTDRAIGNYNEALIQYSIRF
jgi:hypothetical protein